MCALERTRLSYIWAILLVTLLGIGSLAIDTTLRYRLLGVWPAQDVASGIASIVVSVYTLTHIRIIKQVSMRALARLRRFVQVDDQAYEGFACRLLRANGTVEAVLLAVAALLVLVFLVLPPTQLRALAGGGAGGVIGIAIITLFYITLFWLVLSLVYVGIRNAVGLSRLAGQPLIVNVFDPDGLLPFGRLSLVQSLAFVGVFLIPLIILGTPTRGGWLVIGLSALCLLALFAPLWGVHQQMVRARERVLANICGELMGVQQALLSGASRQAEQLQALAQETDTLFELRKHILSSPTWPFRDSSSVFRAAVAAASPLIYFVLNELVQTYVFPMFGLK